MFHPAHYLLFIPSLLLPRKTILEEDRNESIPWYSPFSYKKGGWGGDTLNSFLDVHNTQKSLLIGPVLTRDTRFRCPKELSYEWKDKVAALVQNLSVAHSGGKKQRLSPQHPAQSPCWLSEDTTQTKLSSAASIRTFRNFLPKWKLKCNRKHIHRETGREGKGRKGNGREGGREGSCSVETGVGGHSSTFPGLPQLPGTSRGPLRL